jgi:hypothetical protein
VLRRLTVVAALLVHAAVPDAWAQRRGGGRSSQPAEDPVRAEARAHFEAGIALMRVQNWEGAQLEFERSMETYPTPSALFNIGMCQKAQFLYVEAMETFERYLATYANEADPAELTELRSMVDELERLLGQITVTVNVTGATVSLDGEDIGTAPLAEPIRVVAGQYAITARLDGYHAAERAVTVTSGDEVDVALDLREVERVGRLRVEANVSAARVWVDGAEAGMVPYEGMLAEGNHEVRVSADGYVSQVQTVAIATGDERIVTVSLAEPAGTDPLWFWSMVGLTGAATLATVGLGAAVIVKDDEYQGARPPTDAQYDEGRSLMIATDVCLGVAVASAIAGTVLAFTTNWGEAETAEAPAEAPVDVAPAVAPAAEGVGLLLLGRF